MNVLDWVGGSVSGACHHDIWPQVSQNQDRLFPVGDAICTYGL